MLNALWFHADDRRALYGQYSQSVLPIVDEVGADIMFPPLVVDEVLEGDFDPDLAFVVRYPSAEAFDEMWRSEDYARIAPLRRNSLRRAVLTRCAIDPPESGPIEVRPGIAVLNMLWLQPGGRARYDEYLEGARPHVEAAGGRYVTPCFLPEQAIEDSFRPDLIFIGNYPSREALVSVVTNVQYLDHAAPIRAAAVRRSFTTTLRVPDTGL